MADDRPGQNQDVFVEEVARLARLVRQEQTLQEEDFDLQNYRMKLGRETVKLGPVEFRILMFLSRQPYRAYSRRDIASAVSTERQPVGEDTLDQHIASLRNALGFFRDYIQTVPYIGYRFKA